MPVYSIEVTIKATVYIKAFDRDEALEKARDQLPNATLEVRGSTHNSQVEVTDKNFDDPELPEVSLLPSMIILPLDENLEAEGVYYPSQVD